MFSSMRAIRGGLTPFRSTRWYATMAEYRTDFSNGKAQEIQKTFDGPLPVLAHFSTDAPQLKEHNEVVLKQLAKVNENDVKMKLIWADINNRDSVMWLQSMGGQSAPLLVAVHKGKVLDTHGELCTDDFLASFISKFVQFTSDAAPTEVADNIDASSPAGRFAKLALDAQNGVVPIADVLTKIDEIISEVEVIAKEEKKGAPQKKATEPPTATPTEELLARASLFRCATTQVRDNDAASVQLEAIKKRFGRFTNPTITESINSLEMVVACSFTHDPVEIYQNALETTSDEEELYLVSHRLAVALFREKRYQAAVDRLIQLLKEGLKKGKTGPAKTSLVSAFKILGPKNDITVAGRKKMMSYMF